MNIAGTQYNINHFAFEIYLSGCNNDCKNCHNPTYKCFSYGEVINYDKLKTRINKFDDIIKNIWVLGGEPFDQNESELIDFFSFISNTNKRIWVFTKYYKIKPIFKPFINYLKVGEYNEELKVKNYYCYGVKLATSNQTILKLKE